jgi:serine/threonine protein kinase/thiol-disulfide isomerase/thioredoxin
MLSEDQNHHRDAVASDETIEMESDQGARKGPKDFPAKIGQYAVRRVIASGGMGTVYEALQENPRRPVAVKMVRRSMASSEALHRFEREAQALARLRHPGIAQIFEAGTYEDNGVSRPFFALEYIPNARTIIDHARTKKLGVREKLELFLQVCEAVHYGHQRGIIHRDLKPGNILVDSEGRTRIIDFGVARAMDADPTQTNNLTQVGQIVGTAQYMSPEQFEADPNDLDTRSDVYALGVVLFELLAGRLPYRIELSGVFEIARVVREEQPTALGDAAPGIGGEIELIVAKALQKDREYRYQSAFGLAADIRRHLKGEAISAKTTSLSYQARVFARKNKAVVGLAASAVALLVIGFVVTSKLYVDVSAERSRTEIAAAQAIAANEFLKNTLQAAVPPGFGDVRTIGDLCDQVAQDIDYAFPNSPTTEADIRNTIGKIYMAMDRRTQSEQQLRKAYRLRSESLGQSHELTMEALGDLMTYYDIFGPSDSYLQTARKYHEITEAKYGPDDSRTLDARESVIASLERAGKSGDAERMARNLCLVVEKKWGEESQQALYARRLHASQQLEAGQVGAARTTAQAAFGLCNKIEDVAPQDREATKNVYAATLLASGEIEAAKDLYGHRRAPKSLGIVHEYQGSVSELDEAIKVLVFFETWCPYSQRYISRVERLSQAYRDLRVEVVGLTMASRSSSDENVRQFLADYNLTFSVFKENGRFSNYFDLPAVPYTVILHEGEVIWEASGGNWEISRLVEGIVNNS